jgi:hypothetical protein
MPEMREENMDAFSGAVEVGVGVLLELASRAGVQLEDIVAMTRAQLMSGLLPAGISPSAGPATGVAIPDLPSTTAVCAPALGMEGLSARQSTGGEEAVSWDMLWEAETRATHRACAPTAAMGSGERQGEPKGADDRGREGVAGVANRAEQARGAAHKVELRALGGGESSFSDRRGI